MPEINKETLKIESGKLVGKIKQLVKEGNIRRIIIKNEEGEALMEIPLTFAAVGVLAAPVVAAVGALAALITNCTLVIERKGSSASNNSESKENTPEEVSVTEQQN